MYCQVAARFAFLWILKIAVLTPSLSDLCWAYIFINLVPLIKDCALNKFTEKTHLVSVIWQWAWRFGFLDVSLYETKLSLCFPVFLYWVTWCLRDMIQDNSIQGDTCPFSLRI